MNKVINKIFIPIAFFCGLLIGKYYFSKTETIETEKVITKKVIKNVPSINKIHTCKEVECDSSKVKEYYQKAILLFLATISNKITKEEKSVLKSISHNPENFQKEENFNNENNLDLENNNANESIKKKYKEYINLFFEQRADHHNMTQKDLNLILEEPIITKSKAIETSAKNSKFKHIPIKISGVYKGILYREKKGIVENHRLQLEIDYLRSKDGKAEGSYMLKLTDHDGNVYSNNRGSGDSSNIKIVNDTELILVASPGAFIHFKNKNLRKGTFYQDNDFIGFVILDRIN